MIKGICTIAAGVAVSLAASLVESLNVQFDATVVAHAFKLIDSN